MKKKIIALFAAAALAASLSGCASIFDKEYIAITDYVDASTPPQQEGTVQVENYLELKLAINKLITAHEESGSLDFSSYKGENISDDLAAACNEVRSETALAAYVVDYISYDLDRHVSYYEAEVYVYYLHTQEEVEAIVSVGTVAGQERYDADTSPHAHFICRRCGRVLDVELSALEDMDGAVERATGGRVAGHSLSFRGECAECLAKTAT